MVRSFAELPVVVLAVLLLGNVDEEVGFVLAVRLLEVAERFDLLEADRAAGVPLLVMGDFNTAHREIDLARPKQNRETSGFRPEEREELDRWLREGWTDTFRHFEDGPGHYTWWSQRRGVRAKNIGWRIDYVLASPGAMPFLRRAEIHPEVQGSDHCPISVDLDPHILSNGPARPTADGPATT